jgi:polyhydroxybutyrate depolymerase
MVNRAIHGFIWSFIWLGALALAACGTNEASSVADLGPPDLGPTNALVAARPYMYDVPTNYDPAKPTPLVVLLHGYSVNGLTEDIYFGFSRYFDDNGVLYAFPDGTKDHLKNRFWSATDACCGDFGTVDDVAYLSAIVADMQAKWNVDPKRIYFAGHSNGGFMAHRMACERADLIAGIVTLAGVNWNDPTKCNPSGPVAVLEIHGTADTEVLYNGGTGDGGAPYPSALASIQGWAMRDGCGPTPDTSAPPLDLDSTLPGAETTVQRWTGCKPGGAAELWTIQGGTHIPAIGKSWAGTLWNWMSAHPKP